MWCDVARVCVCVGMAIWCVCVVGVARFWLWSVRGLFVGCVYVCVCVRVDCACVFVQSHTGGNCNVSTHVAHGRMQHVKDVAWVRVDYQ